MEHSVQPPPDLTDWPEVMSWAVQAAASGTSQQELADTLAAAPAELGKFRALTHLMRTPGYTKDQGLAWLRSTYTATTDQLIKIMVLSTAHHLGVRDSLLFGEKNEKTTQSGLQILAEHLQEVQALNRTGPLPLEAEYRIYHAMLVTALTLNETQEVQRLISRLMEMAEMIGHKELSDRTSDLCMSALVSIREYSSSIAMGHTQLQRPPELAFHSSYAGVISDLATAYIHIGAYHKARAALDEGLQRLPQSPSLLGYRTWIEAQAGRLSAQTLVPEEWDRRTRYGWQIEAFQNLSRALAEDAHRPQQRRQQFLKIVDITNEGVDTRLSHDAAVERWLRARARLGLGEYALALSELSRIEPLSPQDLLHRAWVNALQIEVGLTTLPQLARPMLELEEEARQIYTDLGGVDQADAEGLAQLTARWLPGAAAYLGLMPQGIAAYRPALEVVFRIGARSRWGMVVVPPPLALSLTLEALGKDYTPTWSTNINFQVRPLRQLVGEAEVWGPIVAPLSPMLGLLRGGHLEAARDWLSVTAMAPAVKGSLQPAAETIQTTIKRAADGQISFNALLGTLHALQV